MLQLAAKEKKKVASCTMAEVFNALRSVLVGQQNFYYRIFVVVVAVLKRCSSTL